MHLQIPRPDGKPDDFGLKFVDLPLPPRNKDESEVVSEPDAKPDVKPDAKPDVKPVDIDTKADDGELVSPPAAVTAPEGTASLLGFCCNYLC